MLSKYKGIDLYAYYMKDELVYANTIHHIVEREEDKTLELDVDNLFPVSAESHNTIHSLYEKDKEGTQRMLREILEKARKELA
ncbi:HNH endonuclease [Gottschalkia purinilytica]|uniref:HNH endonuclease n=1 Tax=Gottschalkia purinilytica TaxID=1503 RepID=A0A0L0W653_GOTPU|nr:hypothetical protein [Gottschalkia purinilytica]KNF06994.1 HNH endonuclease [Gottschalkia purinilytica]